MTSAGKSVCMMLLLLAGVLPAAERPPEVLREMRGVWVATVANIDWPSRPGLTTAEQQAEVLAILDRIQAMQMNAVVLQVRPHADALYASELEPWSGYLTGMAGQSPDPWYDPLQFWIEQAHSRAIELHAWFNPYRAGHPAMHGEIPSQSVIRAHPQWVHALADTGYYWLDPAQQEVQDHSYAVVMDVVNRYDIDGVHFDDYFYPYREYNRGRDFPDSTTWAAYRAAGGGKSRDDWRRDAVNRFIKRVYKGIKKAKPWVKFGISPFGYYRPGHPAGMGGRFDQYAILYADARLWLNRGWIDYYTPQIYWSIANQQTSFPLLLKWWEKENKKRRNLWPGLYLRPGVENREMAVEIVNQVMVTRAMSEAGPGTILFSMKSLLNPDSVVFNALRRGPFSRPALVPASTWLDKKAPPPPELEAVRSEDGYQLSWRPRQERDLFLYVLQWKQEGRWNTLVLPASQRSRFIAVPSGRLESCMISAVDRCGNSSEPQVVHPDGP